MDNTNLRLKVFHGVDVKRLQYEENAINLSYKIIDLPEAIGYNLFNKPVDSNCAMINIEKDTKRYSNTVKELQKISVTDFVHIKATYWKDRAKFQNDLSDVLEFLKGFNGDQSIHPIYINEFSEPNDPNIYIQDGPLACYVSHLRAMIYGYYNFKDYTMIVEDDIAITNAENIEKHLVNIPDDWDIILMNCATKDTLYEGGSYRLTHAFHSTHCYIINNKCFPFLFKHLYPITDQVDVLISNLVNDLKIYNITDTIYQKGLETNTQNNLHVMFNSPHYGVVRDEINNIKRLLLDFSNTLLVDNSSNNEIIVAHVLYDTLYRYVTNNKSTEIIEDATMELYSFNPENYEQTDEYVDLLKSVEFFIRCSKKGINTEEAAISIVHIMLYTIVNFTKLHNTVDVSCTKHDLCQERLMKAYSFGSSCHTYLSQDHNVIIKKYNIGLRWATEGHSNIYDIFDKELKILQTINGMDHVPQLLSYDRKALIMKLSYCGESLYDHFNLPPNWQQQIIEIFDCLQEKGIAYSEFRLQNILVLNNKISFIDFGLAEDVDSSKILKSNKMMPYRFTNLLKLLSDRLTNVTDMDTRHLLINRFLQNRELMESVGVEPTKA